MELGKVNSFRGIISRNILFETTLSCKIKDSGVLLGTGFFYKIKNNIFCVTNKHVINNANKIQINYNSYEEKQQVINHNNMCDLNLEPTKNYFKHSNPNVDICFIKMENVNDFNVFCISNQHFFDVLDFVTHFNNESTYPNVFMRGFPEDAIFAYNRLGSLSSNILDNNDKLINNKVYNYLCDNHSIGGYSGSPIFIKLSNSSFGTSEKMLFLGINFGHKSGNISVLNDVVVNVNNKLITQIQNTGMYVRENTRQSYIISSSKILEIEYMINTFEKNKNIAPFLPKY